MLAPAEDCDGRTPISCPCQACWSRQSRLKYLALPCRPLQNAANQINKSNEEMCELLFRLGPILRWDTWSVSAGGPGRESGRILTQVLIRPGMPVRRCPAQASLDRLHALRDARRQRSTVTLHHAEWAEGPVAQKWNYRQKSLYLLI